MKKRMWSSTQTLCLLATLAWGLVAHAYGFLNGNFSHDSLNAFHATWAENRIKTSTGRFFVEAYRFFTRGDVVLPWLIGLLALLWVGLAVYFVVRLLDVESKPVMVLISGIMITNITITAQTAAFIHELDCNCFAMMLAVLAAWLWRRYRNIPAFALGAVLLMGSMGIYQAYFSTAAALMVFRLLLDLVEGREIKPAFLDGLRAVAMLLCGAVLYFCASQCIYRITGISAHERPSIFALENIADLPGHLLGLAGETWREYFTFLRLRTYSEFFKNLNVAEAVLTAVLAVALSLRTKNGRAARAVLTAAMAMLMPFAMNFTYFLVDGASHELMIYSIWLTPVFFLAVLTRTGKAGQLSRDLCIGAGCVLVALLLVQNVKLSNAAYMKKDMEAKAALSNMTRVVAQMEQREDYVFGQTPVAFVGTGHASRDNHTEFDKVRFLVGVWETGPVPYDTSVYYYNAYKAYFDYVLNYPLVFCEDTVRNELVRTQQVQDMPAFPDKGYMQMIDGVLVVKMG